MEIVTNVRGLPSTKVQNRVKVIAENWLKFYGNDK